MATDPALRTLPDRFRHAADLGYEVTFVNGDLHVTVPWKQVLLDAEGMAAALQARGVRPGDHVAVLGPTTRALVTSFQAIWLCGATLVVIPIPMRMGSIDEFLDATRARLRRADVSLLLLDPDIADFYAPAEGDPPAATFADLTGERTDFEPVQIDPASLAILQFTSGSTSEPKGVMLRHENVCANLDAIAIAAEYDVHDDVLVSWLPLYHDMGLIGLLLTAMCGGGRFVQAAPQDFLAKPVRWMEWLSQYGGSATAGPNFSWVLATKALKRAKDLDLSRLRVALNGAEPIHADQVRAFVEAGEPFGLRPGCIFPAFGMAEVCIAGTFPVPMAGMLTDVVDTIALEAEGYASPTEIGSERARELVRLGKPVPGLEVRIVDRNGGHVLGEREVGELQIAGTSVMAGYYGAPDATALAFDGKWLRTGDLAYLADGDLVLCGRIKDVIIIGGRNLFPEDIERAAASVEGVRPGNVIAFGIEGRRGKETVVVVAEVRDADEARVHDDIHHRVLEATGVPPHDICLVRAGTLPKTSSGKLQRSLCKQLWEQGRLEPISA